MRVVTHYFSVTRSGTANILSNLGAYLYPAGPNIVAFIDYPASKAFQVLFDGSPDLHEQDLLIDESDPTKTYLVTGVSRYTSPRLAHTSATVRAMWGCAGRLVHPRPDPAPISPGCQRITSDRVNGQHGPSPAVDPTNDAPPSHRPTQWANLIATGDRSPLTLDRRALNLPESRASVSV